MGVVALILVAIFVLLLVMNVPIAVAIAMATFFAVLADGTDPTIVVAAKMANGVNSFALLAIPFFILSGHLMGRGGMARRLGLWRVYRERNEALKNLSWRLILIAAVILAAVIYVIPTFRPGIWPHKKINLGLDLQGGMHLVLEVEADKAVENTIERVGQEMRDLLRKERIRTLGVERVETFNLAVKIAEGENVQRFEDLPDHWLRLAQRGE